MVRLASAPQPKLLVVRVDEVSRGEAMAYEAMEAQADPLDPTTGFVADHYSRRRGTVREYWGAVSRVPDAAGGEVPSPLLCRSGSAGGGRGRRRREPRGWRDERPRRQRGGGARAGPGCDLRLVLWHQLTLGLLGEFVSISRELACRNGATSFDSQPKYATSVERRSCKLNASSVTMCSMRADSLAGRCSTDRRGPTSGSPTLFLAAPRQWRTSVNAACWKGCRSGLWELANGGSLHPVPNRWSTANRRLTSIALRLRTPAERAMPVDPYAQAGEAGRRAGQHRRVDQPRNHPADG